MALVVAAREGYLKKWYSSYHFPRKDLNQSLKQRGIQTIDIFALAKIMGVHIIEYDADNGSWGYYAGNNRGAKMAQFIFGSKRASDRKCN